MDRKILFIEDEESVTFAIKNYLERRGYRVDVAVDIPEARLLMRRFTYPIIITDLCFGNPSEPEGLALLSELEVHHPQIATFVLTAHANEVLLDAARRLGVREVLKKPFPLIDLLQAIQRSAGT